MSKPIARAANAPHEFKERLVPRYPTAQASQAHVNCAEPAAPAAPPVAGAAFHHFTETCPHATGQAMAAPAPTAGAVILSIAISPAVALILKLAGDATGLAADEIVARGICTYADRIGIPSLARPAADDDAGDDIGDVPHSIRRDQRRFSIAREALGNSSKGMRR